MASTPCAACKLLRRKCTQECVFAPYFPASQPQRFAFVHRVFGASNVAKILNELPVNQREDAVHSLYYEAEARLRDPIYGCVGLIAFLQQNLKKVQRDIVSAKNELAAYAGADAASPYPPPLPGNPPPSFVTNPPSLPNVMMPVEVVPVPEAMLLEQQQHRQHLTASDTQRIAEWLLERGGDQGIFSGGFGSVTATGFNQMDVNAVGGSSSAGPPLALGSFGDTYQINQEHGQCRDGLHPEQLQTQLMLQPPEPHNGPEGQFLIQPMAENEPEQIQQLQPQPPIDGGGRRVGSEEASG